MVIEIVKGCIFEGFDRGDNGMELLAVVQFFLVLFMYKQTNGFTFFQGQDDDN